MDLREYLRILRKNWWIVVAAAVIGIGGAILVNERAVPQYQSSVTFYVSTPSSTITGSNALQANQYALDKMDSYTKLLKSDALAQRVIAKSGLDISIAAVTGRITATSDLNTVLLEADILDENPTRSLVLATAVSTEFGALVDQLDNRTVDGVSGSTVQMNVVSGPTLNPVPVSPRKNLNLAIGLAVGLLIGAALALARGLLDTTIRTTEDLGKLIGTPVLGTVGFESAARKYPVLVASQNQSIRAESFRQLRTNLQFMNVDNPVSTLVITSSVAGEGKSTTATNLAIVYAEAGRKVLLIEADMRRGRIAEYLGLEDAVGLSNVLAGAVDVHDVLQPWGADRLHVLLRGESPPNPSELLGSHHMVELIATMREEYDVIVVDAPPLLPVADAAVASTWADGVLVVVRWGKTTRSQIATSMDSLEGVDARVLGAVLTMRPHRKSDRAKGYRAYGVYDEELPRQQRFRRRTKAATAPSVVGRAVPVHTPGATRFALTGRDSVTDAEVDRDLVPTDTTDPRDTTVAVPHEPPASDNSDANDAGSRATGSLSEQQSGPRRAATAQPSRPRTKVQRRTRNTQQGTSRAPDSTENDVTGSRGAGRGER